VSRHASILFATGRDRPGIVDRLTGVIYDHGCNLEDSRMAVLGEDFALIVLITGTPDDLSRVEAALPRVTDELGLTSHFKRTLAGPGARKGQGPAIRYRVHAVALDHPGIVHKLTRILSEHGVNVVRLDTSLSNAPVTGTPVFSLELEAEVPADVPMKALRGRLERLAETESIDFELRAIK
jgi:glycine cleavage system transcriptional repressor